MKPLLTIVAAVNNQQVLSQNLMRSPVAAEGQAAVILECGHPSAGAAYNAGLDKARSDYVAFVHQDVYLPPGWDERLARAIDRLDEADPKWAVAGPFGVTSTGTCVGRAWSTGIGAVVGQSMEHPTPVVSFDELVLVLRKDSGIRFDPALPGFHLYGTDIVQTALVAGRTAYAFHGPVIHNSLPVRRLDASYRCAYRYMQQKWRNRLPLMTAVVPVTRWGWPLKRNWMRDTVRMHLRPSGMRQRHEAPERLAEELGFVEPLETAKHRGEECG